MKLPTLLSFALAGLVGMSMFFGLYFESKGVILHYSSVAYLLLCFATAGHFLEENHYKVWALPAKFLKDSAIRSKLPNMPRRLFILFSHSLVITSFLFYLPISTGAAWAMLYGLGLAILFGISNGIAHGIIYIKIRQNTGVLTGLFQLIFGLLVWISFLIPLV